MKVAGGVWSIVLYRDFLFSGVFEARGREDEEVGGIGVMQFRFSFFFFF